MRQQWAGFKDYETGENAAPEDYLITLDSPIKFLHYISTYLPDIKNKVLKSKNNEFDKKNKFLN